MCLLNINHSQRHSIYNGKQAYMKITVLIEYKDVVLHV